MTMPNERTRSLLQTGAFLKELHADQSLPEHVRNEAHRLLRHYPTVDDLQLMAQVEERFMGANLLTPQFDSEWLKSYRLDARAS